MSPLARALAQRVELVEIEAHVRRHGVGRRLLYHDRFRLLRHDREVTERIATMRRPVVIGFLREVLAVLVVLELPAAQHMYTISTTAMPLAFARDHSRGVDSIRNGSARC